MSVADGLAVAPKAGIADRSAFEDLPQFGHERGVVGSVFRGLLAITAAI